MDLTVHNTSNHMIIKFSKQTANSFAKTNNGERRKQSRIQNL